MAIDLEWRPDYGQGKAASRVALMQLATSYHCLLIRLCRIDAKRLCALIQFLRCLTLPICGALGNGARIESMLNFMN